MSHDHDHEPEPIPGLPGLPPPGEEIIWQGSPDWRLLERQAFHVRGLSFYFGFFIVARGLAALVDGAALPAAIGASLMVVPLAALGLALVRVLAWVNARATIYTITNRRVVMRIGVALPMTFNLPFRRIAAAELKRLEGGAGEIALTLAGTDRLAYLHLWPHARPWRYAKTSPMLRALPDGVAVAELLAQAATGTAQVNLQDRQAALHAAPQVEGSSAVLTARA